ncbi:hypothetical protein Q8W71_02805 [Methylobacterium sp. NEAU 140]|uniref:hypothetical protein n=1 Tax=Methylobacterium sp. NEAU 140 TaxID=3064945 RepID=UPI002734AA18|nr:hypothetical protein [Methylobacterium sp. NEAU 140]MDP4021540.1 hypothetical protein [Methylobacterium sp. NEAU 140]
MVLAHRFALPVGLIAPTVALIALTATGSFTPAAAQAQPPIKSAQDAACRDEAQGRVFNAPNPQGLSMYDLGAQIYRACMQRSQSGTGAGRGRRRQPE